MLDLILIIPVLLQGLAMMLDEVVFHQRRGLGRWERVGHPVDSSTVILAYSILIYAPFGRSSLLYYGAACALSCLMITKDESVHQKECLPGESWLHSVLFILHPLVLLAAGLAWFLISNPAADFWREMTFFTAERLSIWIKIQAALVVAIFTFQTLYWNFLWKPTPNKQ